MNLTLRAPLTSQKSTVINTSDGNTGDDWVILNFSSQMVWEGESHIPDFCPTTILSLRLYFQGNELVSP